MQRCFHVTIEISPPRVIVSPDFNQFYKWKLSNLSLRSKIKYKINHLGARLASVSSERAELCCVSSSCERYVLLGLLSLLMLWLQVCPFHKPTLNKPEPRLGMQPDGLCDGLNLLLEALIASSQAESDNNNNNNVCYRQETRNSCCLFCWQLKSGSTGKSLKNTISGSDFTHQAKMWLI